MFLVSSRFVLYLDLVMAMVYVISCDIGHKDVKLELISTSYINSEKNYNEPLQTS